MADTVKFVGMVVIVNVLLYIQTPSLTIYVYEPAGRDDTAALVDAVVEFKTKPLVPFTI